MEVNMTENTTTEVRKDIENSVKSDVTEAKDKAESAIAHVESLSKTEFEKFLTWIKAKL